MVVSGPDGGHRRAPGRAGRGSYGPGPRMHTARRAPPGKGLEAFFRKGLVAVSQVVDGADAAIGKPQIDADLVVSAGPACTATQGSGLGRGDRMAGEMAQQVYEMAGLTDDPPTAHLAVLRPVLGGDRPRVDGHHEGLGLTDARQ